MENNSDIFHQEVKVKLKANAEKPPTRLQKHAPATLQLDQVTANDPCAPSTGTPSTGAIPFLSPLILSPPPLMPDNEETRFPKSGNNGQGFNDEKKGAALPPGGWQHPAVATFTEPSSLLTLFQSQCVLVNQAQ